MAPKSSTQSGKKKPTKSSQPKINVVKLNGSQPPSSTPTLGKKRFDPLTAFRNATPPSSGSDKDPFTLSQSQERATGKAKGLSSRKKGKEKEAIAELPVETLNDRLWVDLYEPNTEGELAVHVRKVEDVRRWLTEAFEGGPSGKLKRYRRILAMTGPAGTGKTSTLKILSREMGFEIVEWKCAIGEMTPGWDPSMGAGSYDWDDDGETIFTKFETFFNRAARCQNIFSSGPSSSQAPKRQIILLEDLPNILHPKIQADFHAYLKNLTESPPNPPVPVVIVISDAGIRGEARDERMSGGFGWGKDKDQIVDVRTVLSRELLHGPYVTQISFNPIAPTLMRKALQSLLDRHFSSCSTLIRAPSKQVLDVIVESSNGDIRSAIMALQFACIVEFPSKKRKGREGGAAIVLEAVTRREQSLALFHLIGKVMYNKRKGDPPTSSATAKDIQKERELDALLHDPPKLPDHLQHHDRRASRVDVDLIYANSPIDSSLHSLYVHQNYVQFCNDVDEVDGIADCLSWVDSSGGEAWYQANPHQFHLVTLGTLHSLPSPVIRRSQKIYKPEFFEFLQKEKDARDALRLARDWVVDQDMGQNAEARRVGAWSSGDVVLELGAILKAKESRTERRSRPPRSHRLFSSLVFSKGDGNPQSSQITEGDGVGELPEVDEESEGGGDREDREGGCLESDDIEDFD